MILGKHIEARRLMAAYFDPDGDEANFSVELRQKRVLFWLTSTNDTRLLYQKAWQKHLDTGDVWSRQRFQFLDQLRSLLISFMNLAEYMPKEPKFAGNTVRIVSGTQLKKEKEKIPEREDIQKYWNSKIQEVNGLAKKLNDFLKAEPFEPEQFQKFDCNWPEGGNDNQILEFFNGAYENMRQFENGTQLKNFDWHAFENAILKCFGLSPYY